MKKVNVRAMVASAVCAALIVICSQLAVTTPSGVPLTLQTFAIAFTGYLLGPGWGTAAVGVYLLLGAVGVPVFAGFQGGIGMLFGYTAGFLWGFLPMAALCGWKREKLLPRLLWGTLGLLVCHAAGITAYSLLSGKGWIAAFLVISLPYLLKDILSLTGAAFLAPVVSRALRLHAGKASPVSNSGR